MVIARLIGDDGVSIAIRVGWEAGLLLAVVVALALGLYRKRG